MKAVDLRKTEKSFSEKKKISKVFPQKNQKIFFQISQ